MPVRVQEKPKSKIKIKRNDQVIVIAGKDAGKKGRVLRVLADKNRLLVEGAISKAASPSRRPRSISRT